MTMPRKARVLRACSVCGRSDVAAGNYGQSADLPFHYAPGCDQPCAGGKLSNAEVAFPTMTEKDAERWRAVDLLLENLYIAVSRRRNPPVYRRDAYIVESAFREREAAALEEAAQHFDRLQDEAAEVGIQAVRESR